MISWPVWISGVLFALVHSLFAAQFCKAIFYRLGISSQRYRLLYSLFATCLTGLWIFYIYQLPDTPLYRIDSWLYLPLTLMQLGGVAIALLSLRSFDVRLFLGLSTTIDNPEPFHEHGLYRYVRHPMYSGVMLALLSSPTQSVNSFNFALIISCYFVFGSWLEERRMLSVHPQYAGYRSRVSAFIPWRTLLTTLRRS